MKPLQSLKTLAARFPRRTRLPEECACRCHRGAPLLHVVDCCKSCPNCHRRIATAFYNTHLGKCGKSALNTEN